MTAADLSGRDLDVAVARAFGWEWVDVPPDYRGHHSGRVLVRSVSGFLASGADFPKVGKLVESFYVPRYSTDPATLGEMLAWLNSHVWLGGVMLFEEPRRHPKLGRWIAIANECTGSVVERGARDDDARRFRVEGETIHEAVARLVVAVKEEMGQC